MSARRMITSSPFCLCYPLLSAMWRGHVHMVWLCDAAKDSLRQQMWRTGRLGTGCRLTVVAADKHFSDAASPQ